MCREVLFFDGSLIQNVVFFAFECVIYQCSRLKPTCILENLSIYLIIYPFINLYKYLVTSISSSICFVRAILENIDECVGVDCNNGECVDGVAAYTCSCEDGYSGALCEGI